MKSIPVPRRQSTKGPEETLTVVRLGLTGSLRRPPAGALSVDLGPERHGLFRSKAPATKLSVAQPVRQEREPESAASGPPRSGPELVAACGNIA